MTLMEASIICFIAGAIRALHCVPDHRRSTVINPMRLMLLVILLFGAAPQIIALSPKVAMAFACVDAVCSLPSSLNVNVKMFKKRGKRRESQRLS